MWSCTNSTDIAVELSSTTYPLQQGIKVSREHLPLDQYTPIYLHLDQNIFFGRTKEAPFHFISFRK